MKRVVRVALFSCAFFWSTLGFSKFNSVSDIDGTWIGQEDRGNCVFPATAKFVSLGNIVTGIVQNVSSWYSETCEPIGYSEDVLHEGFLREDSSSIIFPMEGSIIEFFLSEDRKELKGTVFSSGKLYSKYVLEREK